MTLSSTRSLSRRTGAQPNAGRHVRSIHAEASGRKALGEQHVPVADRPWTYDPANVPAELKSLLSNRPSPASAPSNPNAHAPATRSGS